MNKKNTSDKSKGVKYPSAVMVDGLLVNAIDIDKSDPKWKGVTFYFVGCEGDEEEIMLFVTRKHRKGVTKFFRHKSGYIGERNDQDRQLHNYSEVRIKQRFDESVENGQFLVHYYEVKSCPFYSNCKNINSFFCKGQPRASLKTINLRELYDTCSLEKSEDKYIADLLLTNSEDSSIKPMFLEIFVTHKCSEEKIKSGNQIIEIKINKAEDAENEIIENAGDIVEENAFLKPYGEKVVPPIMFYGFDRYIDNNDKVEFLNFTLTKDNQDLFGNCSIKTCFDVDCSLPDNTIISLSIPKDELKNKDIYEYGMALAHKKGFQVRDCSLCHFYKLHNLINRPCRLVNVRFNYKDKDGVDRYIQNPQIFQLPYRLEGFDKSKYASTCNEFCYDEERISRICHEIESMHAVLQINETDHPIEMEKEVDIENEKITPPQELKPHDNKSNYISLRSCCYQCELDRWDCGFSGNTREKKDGTIEIMCSRPDKSFLDGNEVYKIIFKPGRDCPF